jgi:hypothetical protein
MISLENSISLIKKQYPEIILKTEGGVPHLYIPHFPLPPGWKLSATTLRLIVGSFPMTAPIGLYVNPQLETHPKLPAGSCLVAFGRNGKDEWLYLPYKLSMWDSRTYTLATYLQGATSFLRKHSCT